MSLIGRRNKNDISQGLNKLKQLVYIRSDNEDYIRYLCKFDHHADRLKFIIANTIIANHRLDRRIFESTQQDNAAITWDAFGQRGTGKSWLNFYVAYKILKSRGVSNPVETIIFKDSAGNIINTPSRWNDGIKIVGNSMEHKDDGFRFALLQDEMDPEWGEGRVKQEKNQNAAVDNLRKLRTLVAFAHVMKEDCSFNLDMRFLMLGYNKHTRVMAAILHYTRPQGIVLLKIPKELANYLQKEYNEDAVENVWEKAKSGFHQSATNPDGGSTGNNSSPSRGVYDDVIVDLTDRDRGRVRAIRDYFKTYWMSKHEVNEPYARILSSFYIWEETLKVPNSNRKISPSQLSISNLPLKQISKMWVDEVGPHSFNQAKYSYADTFEGYEDKINTHDLEEIGENYACKTLSHGLKNLDEHVIPPLVSAVLDVVLQFSGSEYLVDGGKPFDLVVLSGGEDLLAINHKLMTSGKRIGRTQYSDLFGRSVHPVSVLWFTWTRPFREEYYIRTGVSFENIGGLGAQTDEWVEITFNELLSIIVQLVESHR